MPEGTLTLNNIAQLSAEAAAQWTARFNPRDVSEADFAGLYAQVMS